MNQVMREKGLNDPGLFIHSSSLLLFGFLSYKEHLRQ